MSASYLGSLPVTRETSTYVDQDGVKFSSMLITATAVCGPAMVPAIGSTYSLDSNLWVTQSDLSYSSDGFAKINVTAAGPDATAKPRVRIIPGAPRIYGLSPATVPQGIPYYHPSRGVTVEVTFVAAESDVNNVVGTYLGAVMPSSIGGLSLPVPASGSREILVTTTLENYEGDVAVITGYYSGFVCMSLRTEQRGRATVVVLSFQESGYVNRREANGSYTTVFAYNT